MACRPPGIHSSISRGQGGITRGGSTERDLPDPLGILRRIRAALAQGGPSLGERWGSSRAREFASQAGFGHFAVLPAPSPAMASYELRA
ncbi:MAG: hypothetical protein M9951_20355 [Burkholderiaceae bacterium]|nr:hypothetical protein [Burkholderiaceae bacterium]